MYSFINLMAVKGDNPGKDKAAKFPRDIKNTVKIQLSGIHTE